MRILMITAMTLVLAAPALAGDPTPGLLSQSQSQSQLQPQSQLPRKPVIDMDSLLRELRDLDSSQDDKGDHVVGELLC